MVDFLLALQPGASSPIQMMKGALKCMDAEMSRRVKRS